MSELKPHPLALEYERISQAEADFITADMKSNGYDETWPIVLYEKMILDGVTRQQCADAAGVRPCYATFDGTPEEARTFVRRANLNRRHLTEEQQAEKRTARIERVVAARVDGQSLRKIAAAENVSRATVARDIEQAQLSQGVTVEPQNGVVKGLDGKRQPASRKVKPKEPPPPAETDDDEGKVDDAPWVDAWGVPITASAAEAFKAQDAFDELIAYLRAGQKMFKALATLPGAIYLSNFWQEGKDGGFTHPGLQSVIHNLQDARPKYTVCPYAYSQLKGYVHDKKCNTCHGLGWMATIGKSFMPPEALINEAKKAHGVEVLGF